MKMFLRRGVDGLAHGVIPPFRPQPVHHEQEGVQDERSEGKMAGERVVEHGALLGDAEDRPYLAVSGDGHEDDGEEMSRANEPHVDRESLLPAKHNGGVCGCSLLGVGRAGRAVVRFTTCDRRLYQEGKEAGYASAIVAVGCRSAQERGKPFSSECTAEGTGL